MLYACLIGSSLIIILGMFCAWAKNGAAVVFNLGALILLGFGHPFLVGAILPPVFFHAALLFIGTLFWAFSQRRFKTYLVILGSVTGFVYSLTVYSVVSQQVEYATIRREFPFQSMVGRVPTLPKDGPEPRLSEDSVWRLERLERRRHPWDSRSELLRLVHEEQVRLFIDSPGLGFTRMLYPSLADIQPRNVTPTPQRGPRLRPDWSPGDLRPVSMPEQNRVVELLDENILHFANLDDMGYVKDRSNVSGFLSHGRGWENWPRQGWRIVRVELVSLLRHEEPVVYETETFPRMDKIAGVPTRPLDRFERLGLGLIRQGDDVFTSEVAGGVRMLGAIRSLSGCLTCHGGHRGDLLGAFSYSLIREPETPRP